MKMRRIFKRAVVKLGTTPPYCPQTKTLRDNFQGEVIFLVVFRVNFSLFC